MKIWKEFGSSHSSNVSITGTFDNVENAETAYKLVEDFANGFWEERYPSLEEFNENWKIEHPNIPYIGIFQQEYETGVDNAPDIELDGNTIKIAGFRSNNIGGLIKLLYYFGGKIEIE